MENEINGKYFHSIRCIRVEVLVHSEFMTFSMWVIFSFDFKIVLMQNVNKLADSQIFWKDHSYSQPVTRMALEKTSLRTSLKTSNVHCHDIYLRKVTRWRQEHGMEWNGMTKFKDDQVLMPIGKVVSKQRWYTRVQQKGCKYIGNKPTTTDDVVKHLDPIEHHNWTEKIACNQWN